MHNGADHQFSETKRDWAVVQWDKLGAARQGIQGRAALQAQMNAGMAPTGAGNALPPTPQSSMPRSSPVQSPPGGTIQRGSAQQNANPLGQQLQELGDQMLKLQQDVKRLQSARNTGLHMQSILSYTADGWPECNMEGGDEADRDPNWTPVRVIGSGGQGAAHLEIIPDDANNITDVSYLILRFLIQTDASLISIE